MDQMIQSNETTHSEGVGKLFEALSKAQGEIQSALKDKKNPFFKSSYADLSSVWDACRPVLPKYGLAVVQTVEGTKQEMFLTTWLGHSSGEWMKSKLPLIVMKQDPQSLGSAITYARRYALSAMVGVCADEDDDGEKAMGRKSEKVTHIERQDDFEKRLSEFASGFEEKDQSMIITYMKKYCAHHKKNSLEAMQDYENHDIFMKDFKKWKSQVSKEAAS
jgi:hypothetical protein